MTAEEVFGDLFDRYGEEFDWRMVPLTDKTFVEELKREIGNSRLSSGELESLLAGLGSLDSVSASRRCRERIEEFSSGEECGVAQLQFALG